MKSEAKADPLHLALRDPVSVLRLNEAIWRDVITRARADGLLARLAVVLEQQGYLVQIPERAQTLLGEARVLAERNQTSIRYEVNRLMREIAHIDVSVILLKGAAYLLRNLPPARGRLASDLDILAPKDSLRRIEDALLDAGWERANLSDYDERYYREWMHEIPAMWHPERRVVVDIHHTIVPVTSRYRPNTNALFEAAVELEDPRLKVLCPADMVLHSAVHLFNEEMVLGLRDLVDLKDLLEHFGKEPGFWDDLLTRARLHGLERPFYYAVHHTQALLGANIPKDIEAKAARGAPPPPLRPMINRLMTEALTPPLPGRNRPARAIALWLLYVRSHWLKMPPVLLARHLSVKILRRWRARLGLTPAKPEAKSH